MPWLQYMHPHAWGCRVLFLCVRAPGGMACVCGSLSAAGAQEYEEWGALQCLPGEDTQLNPNFKGVVEEIGTAVHFLRNRARFSTAICRSSLVFFLFYLLGNKPVNPQGSGNTTPMNPASLPLPPWAPHSRLRSDPQHLGPVPLSPGIPSPAPWGGSVGCWGPARGSPPITTPDTFFFCGCPGILTILLLVGVAFSHHLSQMPKVQRPPAADPKFCPSAEPGWHCCRVSGRYEDLFKGTALLLLQRCLCIADVLWLGAKLPGDEPFFNEC